MIHSRRGLVHIALTGVATTLFGGFDGRFTASAQTTLRPEAALQELMEGNRRFTESRMTSFKDDLDMLMAKTAEKQEPFAAVLSCADSRVPVELIFDQSIGHLFVTRIAGNIATSAIIASLEYGVAVLGTKAVVVLGHANCGAVKASIEAKAVPGQISTFYRYILPAIKKEKRDLTAAIKANAKFQAALLRRSSPVLAEHIKQDKLKIVAGYYDLASGKVTLLD
jgi:carbonic anhydrase